MITGHEKFFVWSEKYRPQTIQECILPPSTCQTLEGILAQENTPNLLLVGTQGSGKTTVARAIVRQFDADLLFINASDERNIDTLRNTVQGFAAALSFSGKRKYVILDEADYLNPQSTQPALRGFMEEYAESCGFILTANYRNKILPPLQSRCSVVEFNIPSGERPGIASAYTKRAIEILQAEKVTYERKVVAQVVTMYFPDFRRVLNELQRHSSTGTLTADVLKVLSDDDISSLFARIKQRNFHELRRWVTNHEDIDASVFYRMMGKELSERVTDEGKLAEMIMLLGQYNYQAALAVDPLINTLAFLTDIMKNGAEYFG